MNRRSSLLALLLSLVFAAGAAADEVAAWLELHGLDELLAVHLEAQLDAVDGDEKRELVNRLATIYAHLLESVDDPVRRRVLEERSRRLLTMAPAGGSHGLRLALLRGTYRAAERTAENHRLRLADADDVEDAKATLKSLIPKLNRLLKQTDDHVTVLERRLSRATGTDAIVLAEEVEQARAVHAQCTFHYAWAMYYQAWLLDRPESARVAQRSFGELLDLDAQSPAASDVSVDLRATEPIARCILGYALCRGRVTTSAAADRWLSLLEHERTFAPLREQVPAWRLVILLEHGEFLEARTLLHDLAAGDEPVPLPWLRLAAVHAIEAANRSRFAADLARDAVTRLAARGELEQVYDLAERYGVKALGTSGFALRYVDGVLTYKQARDAHGRDDPTADASVVALYEQAVEHLDAARRERDAERYESAAPDCTRLIAWCRYFQGQLLAARDRFVEAAGLLSGDSAAEALWMAIVCLDRLVEADADNAPLRDELALTIQRFLEEYPGSEHAPKLVLRRVLTTKEVSPEAVEELLSIPSHSDVYDSAQRRAAQILYQLFRDATGGPRMGYGNRYLLVAVPMLVREHDALDPADGTVLQRLLVRSRRILEVSLNENVARLVAARQVLRILGELAEQDPRALAGIEPEIDFRRLRERLLSGDVDEAVAIADRLWRDARDSPWSRLASRALFKDADRRRREAEELGADDRQEVALIAKFGPRLLAEYADDPDALKDRAVLGYHAAVAEAVMAVWQRSADRAAGARALELFRRLLEARPRNARFLRSAALLAEELDDPEFALGCWKQLVAGLPQSSDGWYEARFHFIGLLAATDPERARAVMDQHRALHAGYGPDPWGARLKALDLRLQRDAPTPPPGGAG
ncbi:MAG: hypothetical protein GY715_17540 [Planctomycetes bacterium]|nr:hypothetical protein [Planctomycetota bacterium]